MLKPRTKLFIINQATALALSCLFICGCGSDKNRGEKTPAHGTDMSSLERRIEDFDDPLSYCQFVGMRNKGVITQIQADELIDYAYGHSNPILFRPASENIASSHYALNFLWLSISPIDEKQPLTGSDKARFETHMVAPLMDWQKKQTRAPISYWYDGDMVKDASIQLTKRLLAERGIDTAYLQFRNIRDIAVVKANAELFTPKIPIYFRVDLAKAAIGDHVLKIHKVPYVANIDTDVAAITKEQLFDQRTLKALASHGYIFGAAFTQEENSFILLHNSSTFDVAEIHKREVLDASIAVAKDKLREGKPIDPRCFIGVMPVSEQPLTKYVAPGTKSSA